MNRDDLDLVLSADTVIEPDAGFSEMVMATVRREAERPPLAFPWRRFGVGVAGIAATSAAAAITNAPPPAVTPTDPLVLSAAALLLTWLCYATGTRLTRAPD